jgi:hypothetical protein
MAGRHPCAGIGAQLSVDWEGMQSNEALSTFKGRGGGGRGSCWALVRATSPHSCPAKSVGKLDQVVVRVQEVPDVIAAKLNQFTAKLKLVDGRSNNATAKLVLFG